jgi:hypothetical protein
VVDKDFDKRIPRRAPLTRQDALQLQLQQETVMYPPTPPDTSNHAAEKILRCKVLDFPSRRPAWGGEFPIT